ncbi:MULTISPECIES: cysteine desulfurase family protein [unclassified Beijerinckia]|uniref:cysteine desulfurase family protein n=1 Tax=unclassified Beijerinckia TaxID=2638183 RepID=UPI0008972D86|nr:MULTISPECIES: cysteine desulfurase family protein [unclassified Beijerinckia]MDH7795849.1 cysteine desulfurase [Beijerinckia sp. GAS462]SEC19041.1 cysteine desulfurase [Beijerinckia sp. 28-YEA-48]
MKPVYLDYNATTPIAPDVLDAMLPYLRGDYGNPSSSYELGKRARNAIETARAQVASLIGAAPDEIVFTSGGTEASNIAIRSGARRDGARRGIVTTNIEHPATDACCALLAQEGYDIRRIKANTDGLVDPQLFHSAIDATTALVSVIHAQNEIGTLQPIADISAIAKAHGALIHADAAQSVGKVKVDVQTMGVDLLSIAGHKLYAPKGIGVLYVRRGVDVPSVLVGAGQEHGRRPGTENVAFIVALGEASRLAEAKLATTTAHVAELADRLLTRLRADIPDLLLAGHATQRLPNTLNILFPGVSGRLLLEACPRVFASTGSACHADREDPSAILLALGFAPERALGAVRLSVGRPTTLNDIDTAVSGLVAAWRQLRQSSSARLASVP